MRTSLLLLALVLFAIPALSQHKVIHEGEACYVHKVEKGNTLYGISKQYAVSIPDLFKMNPDARLGISIGQDIYIPISEVNRKEAKKSPTLEGSILIHTVQRGETIYSLSKKYNVDINAIMQANPSLKDGSISKGQEIRIPTSQVDEQAAVVTPAAQDSLLSHTVLQGETLYGISKLYEVTVDSLKAINGGMPEGLKTGAIIRIPKYRQDFVPSRPMVPLKDSDTDKIPSISAPMKEMKIAYLLPFTLAGSDTSFTSPSQSDIVKMTDISFEFYRGAKFALEDLKEEGLRARIMVMDVGSAQSDIDKAMKTLIADKVDMVIGPLHRGAFKRISNDPSMKGIHFISPVSKVLDVGSVDNSISKVSCSTDTQFSHLVSYLKEERSLDRFILIQSKTKSFAEDILLKWCGRDSSGALLPCEPELTKLDWSRYFESSLEAVLSTSSSNVIIFPSADKTAVTEFVSKLAAGRFSEYDITLIGLEDWLTFENLDADVLASLNFTIAASRYLDTSSEEYLAFMRRYYQSYNAIPGPDGYAFQAYDITHYYVEGMMDHGRYFLENQSEWKVEGLHMGFDMKPREKGCFENTYSVIIQNQGQEFKVLDKH